MKIQKSRNSRQPVKDYSSVCHQQGRMLTDSDLTEQALISRDRLNRALQDVIGSGTPRHGALLQVTEVGDERIPSLHWGRVYVDGVPAEVRADADAPDADLFDYGHQLYYPEPPALPEAAYRLYVDVWERSVSWLEDERLRDPGLHGADTTARTQSMAQVKWCSTDLDPLCPDTNPNLGDARLRLVLRSLATSADPCDPCADELELNDPVGNYLFRVEVHDVEYDAADLPQALVLKWSSENGAEAYATSAVPPDFASNPFVYEFFDEVSEKRLGVHLARDGGTQRSIDGQRPGLVSVFSETSPQAKAFVRRWDGWCRIQKNGSDWQVTAGFEGSIDLTSGVGVDKPGHVTQGGASVEIELRVISLSIELADHALVAGDYWSVPVRESVHQQGEVLLEDASSGGGIPPQGEPHHYLLLADVDAAGELSLPPASGCDQYHACRLPQFPSLTDLRAGDICFDNTRCDLPDGMTVQDALDQLCQERDLRWHNRHLHGWGVVCGLALSCDTEHPEAVILHSGYALDCDGSDMVVEDEFSINIPQRLQEAGIDPGALDEDQGLCLYLEFTEERELDVGIELYEEDNGDWTERFRDTLLYDFYQDCILDLVNAISGELEETEVNARCTLTRCGHQLIRPVKRRALTLANLLFHYQQGEGDTILNVSHCEHALLEDLYKRLKTLLRSRTFCAQFEDQQFPAYAFADDEACRATWFTPENLDHLRTHPGGKLLFGWRRNSPRVFVFQQLEKACLGDLVGYFDIPRLDNGSITDLAVSEEGLLQVTGIVHQEDSLFARGKLGRIDPQAQDCEIAIDWQTSFMCGVKVVRLLVSPWSAGQLYLVGLCKGVYLFDQDELFAEEKIERDPQWAFEAAGHLDHDLNSGLMIATASAAGADAACGEGRYNRLVIFSGLLEDGVAQPHRTVIPHSGQTQKVVQGSDGLVLTRMGEIPGETPIPVTEEAAGAAAVERGRGLILFLVGDLGHQKVLYRFDMKNLQPVEQAGWFGDFHHGFGAADRVNLKYLKTEKLDGVVATRYAMHDMQFVPGDPKRYQNELLSSIPVQAGPVEIQLIDPLQQLVVLNHLGQSITLLSDQLQVYPEQNPVLRQYRADVIAAFYGLLAGLLQYLKDCFCNHLLIECPACDEDDKVYLGCLSLRNGEVYNICNFTKRKFVKTTESIAYWLSLIPVGPLVAWLVEELCCLVLPNYFRQRQTTAFAISPAQLGLAHAVMRTDRTDLMESITAGSRDFARKGLTQVLGMGYKDKRDYQELVGKEYHYRPGVFKPAETAVATEAALQDQIEGIEQGRAETTASVEELQQAVATLKQDKASERLRAEQEVASLKAQLANLEQERSTTAMRMAELEKSVLEFKRLQDNVQPLINAAQPVSSIEGINPESLRILESNRINTVKQLAEADAELLRELGLKQEEASGLINSANQRLKLK